MIRIVKTGGECLVALAAILALSGAAGAACTGNQRTDSLSCAQDNLSSGKYERDVERLRGEADLRRRQEELKKSILKTTTERAAKAEKERKALQAEVERQAEENKRLQTQLTDLRKQTEAAKLRGDNPEAERIAQEIAELEARINIFRDVTRRN